MATTHSLNADTRLRSGSSEINRMRKEGLVPAVVYGGKQDNINLKVSAKTIGDMLHASASENILVDLAIEGESAAKLALVQDVQHDPLTSKILHVDFLAVKEDEIITAQVPVKLIGNSVGVRNGGLIDHHIHSIVVSCLPKNLPDILEIDITDLDVGDNGHVGEINWPEGASPVLAEDVIVVQVIQTRIAKSSEVEEGEGVEGEEGEESAEGADASDAGEGEGGE